MEQRVCSNYLHKFWKQVFAYRNDGEYTIDNQAAERAIRPQTI
nr:IS66 family transposase [Prevotella sp.]